MLERNKKQNQKNIDIFNNVPEMMDLLLPDALQEKSDYLYLGYNKYTRVFVMTIYPEQTWVGWLDDLFKIGNINISVKVEPAISRTVVNQLTKKLVQSESEHEIYSKQRKYSSFTRVKKTSRGFRRIKIFSTNESR